MILFLLKGLLRDRSRSLFPLIVVSTGVMLTVVLQCWIDGVIGDTVRTSANFSTGHVRIMTRAYADNEDQNPNDLALLGAGELIEALRKSYPGMSWVRRIHFGGLLDIPDRKGETRAQGPVTGMAVNLTGPSTPERALLNLEKALVRGDLPKRPGEILLGEALSRNLDVDLGDTATLLGATMFGSMTMGNFVVAGTVRFGITAMERGTVLADLSGIEPILDMRDAAGEILGYFPDGNYHDVEAREIAEDFNARFSSGTDPFSPVMFPLRAQKDLGEYLDMGRYVTGIISGIFILTLSLILWNLGLLAGLRRYGEMGLRLAIGEGKTQVYRSLLAEAFLIGLTGSLIGTLAGLGIARLGEIYGIDLEPFLKNASMMIPNVAHTRITPRSLWIGFIPGILSPLLGSALAGMGIYRRQTAQLFRELET